MVDQRTYARINLSESPEEAYRLTQVILDKLKFKPKEKVEEQINGFQIKETYLIQFFFKLIVNFL